MTYFMARSAEVAYPRSQVSVYRTIDRLVLFLFQNIDCGYTLESPRQGGSNVYPQSMF